MRLILEHFHRISRRLRRILCTFAVSILGTLSAGCMQLQVHVKLNEDGSARITERICFSRRLLDRQLTASKADSLALCLSRKNALARAKDMGSSVKLVEHKIIEKDDGSQESLAVFQAPDMNGVKIQAPFLGMKGHTKGHLVCVVEPCYRTRHASPDQPGWMAVHFHTRGFPKQSSKRMAALPPEGPTPKELQRFREFLPAMAEMLKGFHVKLTFEAYNNLLSSYRYGDKWVTQRGTGIPTGTYTLLDLSDKNLDRWGRPLFESEEALVEVMKGNFGGEHLKAQLGNMVLSRTSAFLYPEGMTYRSWRRAFKPSALHYKMYFDGRPISQGGNQKD